LQAECEGGELIAVLYIFLAFLAIVVAVVVLLLFTPICVFGIVSHEEYFLRIRFLGFWLRVEKDGKKTGFMSKAFRQKPKSEKDETEKKPKKAKKVRKAEEPDKKSKSEVPFGFWWDRRKLIVRVLLIVLKFVTEILASFKYARYDIDLIIGNGAPELTGALYGWLSAFKGCYPCSNIDFEHDFRPDAPWRYRGEIEFRNSLWRFIFAPILRLLWRLPKIRLIGTYRAYKRIEKGSE